MLWWLLTTTALAHGPQNCPPTSTLLSMVAKGPLTEEAAACLGEGTNAQTTRVHTTIAWQHKAWEDPADPSLEGALDKLFESGEGVPLALIAAERLSSSQPAAAERALDKGRDMLAAMPWSLQRQDLAAQWSQATSKAPPPPAAPTSDSLQQCRDLGRLTARALLGGVYGTDRDCVVRLTETLDGEARVQAAWLALSLAQQHDDAQQGRAVAERIGELLPNNAEVAEGVALLSSTDEKR